MSSKARKVIVNCGTTQVSVSIFSGNGDKLVLEELAVENLTYNYTAEGEWEHAATAALRTILSKVKIKGEATVIAPGHLLLTKNARVTQVEKSKQAQIIEFEAQNSFPFPLSELVWGSQVVSSDGVESEVLLYAMKRENAERFAQAMMSAGIKPSSIQPATYLDYQAYRYATHNLTENVMIVNIGAHTTNLTFVNSNGFNIQNISVGGNLLTQLIADAIGKPFQTAEQMKVAYFSGATQTTQDDPLAGTLQGCAENFIRRLSQDITRRIIIAKRANNSAGPSKILISGRGALLPGLAKTLSTLQRVPVEFIHPENELEFAPTVDMTYIDEHRFELSEAIGEAASMIYPDLESVTLLPPQIAKNIAFAKKIPFIIAAMVLFAIAPWPIYLHLGEVGKALTKQGDSAQAQIKELTNRKEKIETAENVAEEIGQRVNTIDRVRNVLFGWNDFLSDLQTRISTLQAPISIDEDGEKTYSDNRHVWIESISPIYTLKTTPQSEDTPEKTELQTSVKIKFRMLIPRVTLDKLEHNNAEFEPRKNALLKALAQSEFIDKKIPIEDSADFAQPNLPTITVTATLKPGKGI